MKTISVRLFKVNPLRAAMLVPALALVAIQVQASSGKKLGGEHHQAELMQKYVEIQEKLASDSDAGVADRAREMEALCVKMEKDGTAGEKALARKLKGALKGLSAASSLKECREAFKGVSRHMGDWHRKHPASGHRLMTCPMAEADWIQKDGDTKNPYFGSSMLACGEEVKTGEKK